MRRLWQFLTRRWVVRTLALLLACALALFVSALFETDPLWALGGVLAAAGLLLLGEWGWRRWRERASDPLAQAIAEPRNDARDEVPALRRAMLDAVGTIKSSKLGIMRGSAALYELPWYMIIGNPAAGKSSAIAHSGLTFPLAGSRALHGVGGTRNCDWFFTTEGIVLDTAGRYSVEDSDRAEWLAFLGLLRRYRPRAPVNGIVIAASVADLIAGPPQKNLELARNLRTRVQELTEHLGVYAPVYVVFTKADLVAGFTDFFHGAQGAERDRAWGATIRYNRRRTHQDVLAFFDQVFDKGTLDDAEGREVDFRNTIIIMTSNAGSGQVMQACLNKPPEEMPSAPELAVILRPVLVRHFKPAFLGRCTVVPFYPLGDEVLGQIVELKLQRIRARIQEQHHAGFEYDESLVDAVLARCTEVDSGARNVDAIIHGSVLPAIAEAVLARIAAGTPISRIRASANGAGEFDYAFEPA